MKFENGVRVFHLATQHGKISDFDFSQGQRSDKGS